MKKQKKVCDDCPLYGADGCVLGFETKGEDIPGVNVSGFVVVSEQCGLKWIEFVDRNGVNVCWMPPTVAAKRFQRSKSVGINL